MTPWTKPAPTPHNYLNLGAGVQSSTLALMAARGEVGPIPDAAIFADTQAEPASVYRWLDWLEQQLPYPVIRVTAGSLEATSLELREHLKRPGEYWSKSLIPAHVVNPDGSNGFMGRACTYDYKVRVVRRQVKRLCKARPRETELLATQWFGISTDEITRTKVSTDPWTQFRYPLVELGMTREDCLAWMERNGYPRPPRSACVFCPLHSDREWRRPREEEPEEFERACVFEERLQATKAQTSNLDGTPYLHRSRVPLRDVDFATAEERGQLDLFGNECDGLCGV